MLIGRIQVMVKNLEKELALLKRELAMHDTLANRSQVTYDPLSEQQRYEIRQQVRAYLDGKSDDIEVTALSSTVLFVASPPEWPDRMKNIYELSLCQVWRFYFQPF